MSEQRTYGQRLNSLTNSVGRGVERAKKDVQSNTGFYLLAGMSVVTIVFMFLAMAKLNGDGWTTNWQNYWMWISVGLVVLMFGVCIAGIFVKPVHDFMFTCDSAAGGGVAEKLEAEVAAQE